MQSPHPAFAHEVFALHKLFAATLSTKRYVETSQTLQAPGLDIPGVVADVEYLDKVVRTLAVLVLDRVFDSRVDGIRLLGGGDSKPGA